jgi:integrase
VSYRKRVGTGIYRSEMGYYSVRYKVDGKAVDRGGFRTLEEARTARNRALADASRGIKQRPRRVSVLDYACEFMTRYEARVRPNSARVARSSMVRHILPYLGKEPVQDLSPRMLQEWVDTIARHSPTAAHRARGLLSVMLDECVRMELLYRNPLAGVRNPPSSPAPRITLTADELVRYLDVVDEPGLAWLALCGARVGEVRAMQWRDLSPGTWVISASMSGHQASAERAKPKTRSSYRAVPVTASMLGLLPEPGRATDFVWGLHSYQHWQRAHTWAVTRAGVPRIRIHDLRHTWATLALAGRTHPKLVQQQLGHARIATTLDTYSHVMPELTRIAAEGIESALSAARGEGIGVGIVDLAEAILQSPRSDEES